MRCVICGADHATCGGPAVLTGTPVGSEVKKMATGMWTAPERVYLDADGNVVKDKGQEKASLLVAAGGRIPMAQAVELGLVEAPEAKKGKKTDTLEEVNVEQLREALAEKDEEIEKLRNEIKDLHDKALPAEPEKEVESDSKAKEPEADKAVTPKQDKAVKPGDNK